MKANTELTRNDRSEILDRVAEVVRKRFYDPQLNGVDWTSLVNERREAIAPDGEVVDCLGRTQLPIGGARLAVSVDAGADHR